MRSVKIYLICLFLGISGIVPLARAQKDSYYYKMVKAPGVKKILIGWPVSCWVTSNFFDQIAPESKVSI
jgi:hypothetical protein